MRALPLLLALPLVAGGAWVVACRSRLPVDHVPRAGAAAPLPSVPPVPESAPAAPPEVAPPTLLHVEYYQISDG